LDKQKRRKTKTGSAKKPRRLGAADREEIFESAIQIILAAIPDASTKSPVRDDFWDPERDINFRPGRYLAEPDPTRFLCNKLIETYSELFQYARRADASPSSIKASLERFRGGLLKIATEMEQLGQPAYRAIIEAAPADQDDFVKEIIPLDWPGLDGRSMLSAMLREKAQGFDRVLGPIRAGKTGTVWSRDRHPGRGHNLLRRLQTPPPAWSLIHLTWRTFEDLGCALPPQRPHEQLALFLSYIHELAMNERDVDFENDLVRYVKLRQEFDPLTKKLRIIGARLGCDNFHRLELYVQSRTITPVKTTAQIRHLAAEIECYRSLRRQMIAGPDPLPRKRKAS
jgi:hypothetical protein